jgi:PAS domain S-box-containing protein
MLRVVDTVLQQLNNLIVVVDPAGKVSYVGPSAERMLGFKTHELLGDQWWLRTCSNIADPGQRKTEVNFLLKQVATGNRAIAPIEHKLKTARGDSRWFLWNLSAGPDGSLVKIGYDITDRKQKELELTDRNREIFESLEYACNIQRAILPSAEKLKGDFADAFSLYLPKDVVSGDFYWTAPGGVAVVDCTGHGVPGALMTIIANAMLKDVVVKRKITEPKDVLKALDVELEQVINSSGSTIKAKDGMDVAYINYDKAAGLIKFAGAFRPMMIVSEGNITEYRGSRYPIGFFHGVEKKFEQVDVKVKAGDMVYIYSDGYTDQFGGERGKKFNKKNFRELLLSMNDMELSEQRSFLEYSLLNWRQKEPQTDDVLVLGFKI